MSVLPEFHRLSERNQWGSASIVRRAAKTENSAKCDYAVRSGFYIRFGKRILDIIGATAALVIAGPILFLCAVAVRLESRGPALFRQWRVGQNGRPFRLIKLRTMIHGADTQGPKITASGDPRITTVGRFLRKTKLDEVPQLFNVLRNEMSLVGPRPEVPEYTVKYSLAERKVLDAKPGITGPASLAHINEEQLLAGRPDKEHFYVTTIMKRKLQLDLDYCGRISLLEDLESIFQTTVALFFLPGFPSKNMQQ